MKLFADRRRRLWLAVLVSVIMWVGCRGPREQGQGATRFPAIAPVANTEGFTRAAAPRSFSFPEDHGPHPAFQTEWWYYTGNLTAENGRRIGYQLTFFRRALIPPTDRAERPSRWSANEIYMAHFALTDVVDNDHVSFERFSRGAAGLAGASATPYRVWVHDWEVRQQMDQPEVTKLRAAHEGILVDLRLTSRKAPILHGDRGYSVKGPEPGNASYYYSQTRLETTGTVQVGEAHLTVKGWSWMDHEFSTGALAPGQVGWDWFALRFRDGGELMVFQIHQSDGSVDPNSSGTLIDPDGGQQHLTVDDFVVETHENWRSAVTGSTYPSRWTIRVPTAGLVLTIKPFVADQELNLSYTYWEGAVGLVGERNGIPLTGDGYIEMTGYADSMQGQF